MLISGCVATPATDKDADDGAATSELPSETREPLPGSPPARASALSSPRRPPADARLDSDRLVETSGLAFSRRDGNVIWAINDSGHAPILHAFDRSGRSLVEWPVDIANRDWEDLAAFTWNGEPWLLIADTGDNRERRTENALYLVPEPPHESFDALTRASLKASRVIRFRYEDEPHDVEAVAVDETTGVVWLLTKEPTQGGSGIASGVYALPLDTALDYNETLDSSDPDRLQTARRRTTLAAPLRSLTARLAAALTGIDLEQPTALDFSADGNDACLLTYRRIRCFARSDGEDWSETFARPGRVLGAHGLEQAEALALSLDGLVWTTSEGLHPRLQARTVR